MFGYKQSHSNTRISMSWKLGCKLGRGVALAVFALLYHSSDFDGDTIVWKFLTNKNVLKQGCAETVNFLVFNNTV